MVQNNVAIPGLVWFCGHQGGDRAWNSRVQTNTWQVCQGGPEHGYLLFPQFNPRSKAETGRLGSTSSSAGKRWS